MSDEAPDSAADLPEAGEVGAVGGAADALSPAVRRLIKLYNLDATKIAGTGPDGRLRVSDVMNLVGVSSSSTVPNDAEPATRERFAVPAAAPVDTIVTSVFECDMTAVLLHRKRMLMQKADILLTSYYLVAAAAAIRAVPQANGQAPQIDLAVALSAPGERTVTPIVRRADRLSLREINRLLREAHQRLAAGESLDQESAHASFLLFHHGLTGSLLAVPTPLPAGTSASLGVGRIRRQLAVQNVSDQQSPRVAPVCYVSLSFRSAQLDIHRANQFLSVFVHRLERWPRESVAPTPAASNDAGQNSPPQNPPAEDTPAAQD
jgi:2-oxoglutarate dehydrogenase E2 component (dihydrolipoamide succinyltransferase)